MAEKLYFIKLLQQALQQPEPQKALQKAFDKIAALGKQHGYEQGHKQFLHFMSLVQANLDGRQAQKEADQRIEPNAHQYLEHIKTLLNGYEPEHMLPGLIVERDGAPFATLMVDVGKTANVIEGVRPGYYSIRLDTGRRLWQGRLSSRDIVWREAFPEEPLALAADTDQRQATASREISLGEGDLLLRVIPGRKSGRLEIGYLG